ncbi:MAG: hypothetical protein ABWY29_01665 [Blastococcus sp.]
MTATVVIAGDDGAPKRPVPGVGSFVDPLVGRLHAEYGVDPQAIRSLAAEVLATFAGARVQAFVPILVEKRVREICRSGGAEAGARPAAVEDPRAALG